MDGNQPSCELKSYKFKFKFIGKPQALGREDTTLEARE